MKRCVVLSSFLLLTVSCFADFFQPFSSWEKTLAKSRKENKPILLYFGAPWCAPCVTLSKDVFTADTVIKILGNQFIAHKFNADLEESFAFKAKFRILSLPLIVVLNADGYMVERLSTIPVDIPEFLKVLSPTLSKKTVYKGVGNKLQMNYPIFYKDYFFKQTQSSVDSVALRNYLDTMTNIFTEENWNVFSVFASAERDYFLLKNNADSLRKLYGQEVTEKTYSINRAVTNRFLAARDYPGYKQFLNKLIDSSSFERIAETVKFSSLREVNFLIRSGYDWELTKAKIKWVCNIYGQNEYIFIINYTCYNEVPAQFASFVVSLLKNDSVFEENESWQYEFAVVCLKANNKNLAELFFEKSIKNCSDEKSRIELIQRIKEAKSKYSL